MATIDQMNKDAKRAEAFEAQFQKEKKKFLEEHPFDLSDPEKQKVAYENLVEKVLRLEKEVGRLMGFVNLHMPIR